MGAVVVATVKIKNDQDWTGCVTKASKMDPMLHFLGVSSPEVGVVENSTRNKDKNGIVGSFYSLLMYASGPILVFFTVTMYMIRT